jgi:hypothetical protein
MPATQVNNRSTKRGKLRQPEGARQTAPQRRYDWGMVSATILGKIVLALLGRVVK